MAPRSITIYRVYQISSHRTLGFYTGDEEAVVKFCNLKYDISQDDPAPGPADPAIYLDQLREHKQRIMELEAQADQAGMKEDIVQLLEETCKP